MLSRRHSGSYRRRLVILVLRGLGTRMIGHYNGGRSCVTLGQLDFVGGGPQLGTTNLLNGKGSQLEISI